MGFDSMLGTRPDSSLIVRIRRPGRRWTRRVSDHTNKDTPRSGPEPVDLPWHRDRLRSARPRTDALGFLLGEDAGFILATFATARVLLSALAAVVQWPGEPAATWVGGPIYGTRALAVPDWGFLGRVLIDGWYRWDTGWYLKIAVRGYGATDGSVVFPPLYPLLVRWGGRLLFGNYLLAAIVISSLACLAALALLYRLARQEGLDRPGARRAVIYLVSFPTAFYLFAGYTEALFLALALATLLLARRERWIWAGIAGGLLTLTRLQGWVIVAPVASLILLQRQANGSVEPEGSTLRGGFSRVTRRRAARRLGSGAWVALALPVLTISAYSAWLHLAGLGSVTRAYDLYWLTETNAPLGGLSRLIRQLLFTGMGPNDWIDFGALALAVALSLVGLGRLSPDLSVYNWSVLAMLSMRSHVYLLTGFSRYMMTLFPIYLVLARWGSRRMVQLAIVAAFLTVQGVLAWMFLNWWWVA